MPKSATITLTAAGTDTGPFNLLSNVDSYVTPFESGIAKSSLVAGYTTNLVPDAATIIRVQSTSALCTNYIDLIYPGITTTSTTTTTTTAAPTTTSTTTTTTTAAPTTTSTTSTTTTQPTTTTTTTTPPTTTTTSTTTTTTTATPTTTTSTTTTTTTLPACVSSVSFDITAAGDVSIKDCCGLSVLNSYSTGSYTETICVPTDGTAITPVDATVTNIVYNLPSCNCPTTTTSTTTTTTTAGQQINIFLSDQFSTVCSGTVFNNVYIPQGSTFTTNTIVYYDSGCTSPMNNTNTYFYVVKNPSSGQTIFDWDGTTGTIGNSVGSC